jgi:hypothetical protein
MERVKRGEITFALIIVLFVLGVTLAIGAAFVVSKEINFSNLILRSSKWFSSALSSLNYGLYKLNMVKEVVPGQEVTIPYFGKENLLPLFYWPSTITILGGEISPITYQGYFGFKDLFYPVSWLFNWLVVREGGQIKSITIQEGAFTGGTQIQNLKGLYYYYDTNVGCSIIKIFNFVYAAIQTDFTLICEGSNSTVLNDGYTNTGKILGDNTSTSGTIENYVAELEFSEPKYVSYVSIYLNDISPNAYVEVSYFPIGTNQTPIAVASTTITGSYVNLNVNQNTQKIRIAVKPNQTNIQASLVEFYAYGY